MSTRQQTNQVALYLGRYITSERTNYLRSKSKEHQVISSPSAAAATAVTVSIAMQHTMWEGKGMRIAPPAVLGSPLSRHESLPICRRHCSRYHASKIPSGLSKGKRHDSASALVPNSGRADRSCRRSRRLPREMTRVQTPGRPLGPPLVPVGFGVSDARSSRAELRGPSMKRRMEGNEREDVSHCHEACTNFEPLAAWLPGLGGRACDNTATAILLPGHSSKLQSQALPKPLSDPPIVTSVKSIKCRRGDVGNILHKMSAQQLLWIMEWNVGRPSVYGLILSQRAGQANCLPLSLFPSLLGPGGTRWSCRMASMRQILGSWHAPSKPVCRCAGDQPSCGQAQPPCLVQPPTGTQRIQSAASKRRSAHSWLGELKPAQDELMGLARVAWKAGGAACPWLLWKGKTRWDRHERRNLTFLMPWLFGTTAHLKNGKVSEDYTTLSRDHINRSSNQQGDIISIPAPKRLAVGFPTTIEAVKAGALESVG
ncbi:hypothetical protein An12g08180 [Aspergillus niger]|uniref:Uncharacterized protein n=2 Tax=Aspergillus niger TaxID=5061 RepID=A2R0D0_ASPNC|nr:hypothetical protein An12g08180 [Aspergillus niger]CAK41268.1 hypothetical protein An12g08180 [Aspergillus niger]